MSSATTVYLWRDGGMVERDPKPRPFSYEDLVELDRRLREEEARPALLGRPLLMDDPTWPGDLVAVIRDGVALAFLRIGAEPEV